MALHEAAQSVVWFAVLILAGIGVILWYDIRKEERDAQKQKAQGTQSRG